MLAAFLLGMFAGSAVYKSILSRRPATVSDWASLQLLIAVFVALTLPFYDRIPLVTTHLYGLTYGYPGWLEFVRFCFLSVFMIIPAFAFGAIFPVSVALFTQRPDHVGHGVGNLYLANTLGNIVGSLSVGFFLIPVFVVRIFCGCFTVGSCCRMPLVEKTWLGSASSWQPVELPPRKIFWLKKARDFTPSLRH